VCLLATEQGRTERRKEKRGEERTQAREGRRGGGERKETKGTQ